MAEETTKLIAYTAQITCKVHMSNSSQRRLLSTSVRSKVRIASRWTGNLTSTLGWDYFVSKPRSPKFKTKQYAANYYHCEYNLSHLITELIRTTAAGKVRLAHTK